ncbi:MAG: c-type cytochrome, partial [Thermodesulfobacteriota bacterium]
MSAARLMGIALVLFISMSGICISEANGKEEVLTPPSLTPEDMTRASVVYFDRCAGCHGTLRGGATGPNLLPEKTRALGTEAIKAF